MKYCKEIHKDDKLIGYRIRIKNNNQEYSSTWMIPDGLSTTNARDRKSIESALQEYITDFKSDIKNGKVLTRKQKIAKDEEQKRAEELAKENAATLSDRFPEFLNYKISHDKIKPKTASNYKFAFNRFVNDKLGMLTGR